MRIKRTLLPLIALLLCALIFTACIENGSKSATITLNYNYGEINDRTVTVKDDGTFDLGGDPTRAGFVFKGWYTDAACNTPFTASAVTENITLYAKWAAEEQFTVTYIRDGSEEKISVAKGGTHVVAACEAEKDGYVFDGTYTNSLGGKVSVGDIITVNAALTLTADYSRAYTVVFDLNGGTAEGLALNQKIKRNGVLEIPAGPSHGTKIFAFWQSDDGMIYRPEETETIRGNMTFTAMWKDTYLLDFATDGGTFENDPSGQRYATDDMVTLPMDKPSKTGYVFAGWFDGARIYQPGAQYKMGAKDTTLTAQWNVGGLVTFHDNTVERQVQDIIQEVQLGTKATYVEPVSRTDYNFLGWYADPQCTVEWLFGANNVNGHVDLYAKWQHVYFRFYLNSDRDAYYISGPTYDEVRTDFFTREDLLTVPETLVLPSSYEGLPVTGILPGIEAFRYLATDSHYSLGLSNLKNIVIPNTFTEIANQAFYWCRTIENYTFEEPCNITRIGTGAFYSNIALKSFTFPSTVTEIGDGAFLYCEGLQRLDMSALSITEIKESAFMRCLALEELLLPPTVEIIHAKAFQNCFRLSEINLPEGLKYIGTGAFGNYNGDETMALSGNLWEFYISVRDENGNYHEDFSDTWSRLQKIEIPSTVEFIGDFAFAWHKNAETIEFKGNGANLKHIGAFAFYRLEKITEINLPAGLEYLGGDVTYDEDGVANGLKTAISGLLSMDDFRGYGATFEGCESLTEITIPECMHHMMPRMFKDCSSLEIVNITNRNIDFNASYRAFANCISLVNFEIPASVTIIGDETFAGCRGLKNVSFEENSLLNTVFIGVFKDCSSLETFTFPDGVSAIGGEVFKGCTSLIDVTLPSDLSYLGTHFSVVNADTSGSTPYGEIFAGTAVRSLYLPSSVSYVAPHAMENAERLEEFIMADDCSLTNFHAYTNRSTGVYASYTFRNCTSLRNVYVGKNFGFTMSSPFGMYAFEGCDNLTEFTVSPLSEFLVSVDGVVFSGGTAFEGKNRTLMIYPVGKTETEYTIPAAIGSDPVTQIFYYAFMGNYTLTKVTLPASVTTISAQAFFRMSAIEEIVFENGSNLSTIGTYAFALASTYPMSDGLYDVSKLPLKTPLKSITLTATTVPTLSTSGSGEELTAPFDYSTENADFAIYVPADMVDLYKEAKGWSKYADKIKPIA